jgi:hypothetical protein
MLDQGQLTGMLRDLSRRAPETHVRWDGAAMPIAVAARLAESQPQDAQVVALLLLDDQRPALCLSTRPGASRRGAA